MGRRGGYEHLTEPKKKTTAKRAKPPAKDLICDACGAHSKASSEKCSSCGSTRFAPGWIQELRRVNRSVTVQVTTAHPSSDSKEPKLTLYKWWPGGKATFNIPTAQQWDRIKSIIDTELAPLISWPVATAAPQNITSKGKAQTRASDSQLQDLAKTEPLRLTKVLSGLKLAKVTDNDIDQISEALGDIAEVLIGADEDLRKAIRALVSQLPEQGSAAIEELSALMKSLTVAQIATVTREVHRRLGLLDLFKERCLDDRTYELAGDDSIHRLLERAMWIVDERYWLLHSNKTLRTIVGNEMAKVDKQFEKKRPDFVCGTVDKRLIIIELKRPSHTLTVADLNQLERYVVLCNQYSSDHSSFEAILVGTKQSDDLKRTLQVRGGNRFQVKTFVDLISDTERRYKRYIDAMKKDSLDAN
jgi:hypothetical protein